MIWMYIRLSFRTLFKEPVLLVPYTAYYAILNIIITLYFSSLSLDKLIQLYKFKLIAVAIGLTLIEAFILGVTLSGIRAVVEGGGIGKGAFLKRSFFVGVHTFFGTAALVPVFGVLALVVKPFLTGAVLLRFAGLGIGVLAGGLLLLFKLFFPAAIVVEEVGWIKAFQQTFKMLKQFFMLSIALSLGLFSFWMIMLILAEIFGQIPVVGLSVFNVGIQAIGAIVAAGVTFFYYSFVTLSPLKTIWHTQVSEE